MNVVIFGLSVSSAWGNGHATLWRGLLRALGRDGHRVTFFERDQPWYARTRDLHHGDGYEIVVYPSWSEVADTAREAVGRADVGMVTSFCADAGQASDLVLGSKAQRIYYDLDTPVTIELLRRGEAVPYLPPYGLGDFDLVLSYTGGRALDALSDLLGAKRTAPLYGSVDPDCHAPAAERDASFECDLSYLGTYAADRQQKVEELFLAPAEQRPFEAFVLAGAMYPETMRRPHNVRTHSHVPPARHPAFYGASRLTLNLTRGAMSELGWCPSGRLFEAAACGVPIVSDDWAGLDEFFEAGREILIARVADDVAAALSMSTDALEVISRRARERVLAQHTAERRAHELLDLVRR